MMSAWFGLAWSVAVAVCIVYAIKTYRGLPARKSTWRYRRLG